VDAEDYVGRKCLSLGHPLARAHTHTPSSLVAASNDVDELRCIVLNYSAPLLILLILFCCPMRACYFDIPPFYCLHTLNL
jgi:hypothetical protein